MKLKNEVFLIILVISVQLIFISCGNSSNNFTNENNINLNIDLMNPINGQEVDQTDITLNWEIESSKQYSYIVYLGKDKNNLDNLVTTNIKEYKINSLQDNTVFYWKIEIPELIDSKVQSFTTKESQQEVSFVSYEDTLQDLNSIENNLETLDVNTLEQSLTIQLSNIHDYNNDFTDEEKDYLEYIYNYNYGWLTLRKMDKNLTQSQINYFTDQIDYNSTEHENYVGLVYQISNDLTLDFTEYETYLDNQINYIRQGFNYKKFGETYFTYDMYVNYLQILYSQLNKNDRISQLENYTNDIETYQQIYEFMYGGYPE